MINCKRAPVLLVAGILLSCTCLSQNVVPISDSVGLNAILIEKGDTVTIIYDSAYVVNKKLYRLYKDIYTKARNGNLVWQELSKAYTERIALQDSLLKSNEFYYTQLKQSFDLLAGKTNVFLDKTDNSLKDAGLSIDKVNANLENIKASLNDAIGLVKHEKTQQVKLVVGGFVIGASLASIVFLIAHH